MNSTPVTEEEYTGYKNHTTNQTTESSFCRDAICVFFAVAHVIIFILGVAGNGLVIWIAGFKVKKTVITTWYLSLAVSDFIFCCTLPFYVVQVINKTWNFGLFICKFNFFTMWLNMNSSTFLLVIISVDRCVLIMFPVWAQNKRTVRKASVIVMLVWISAAALSIPLLVFKDIQKRHYGHGQKVFCIYRFIKRTNRIVTVAFRFVFLFVIPFLIISICYVVITRKLKSNQMVKSRKPFRIMTLVIIMFLISWLPFHIISLVKLFIMHHIPLIIDTLSIILVNANSCLNPFLYAFMGKDIKKECYALRSKIENAFKEDEDQDAIRGTVTTSPGERILSTSI